MSGLQARLHEERKARLLRLGAVNPLQVKLDEQEKTINSLKSQLLARHGEINALTVRVDRLTKVVEMQRFARSGGPRPTLSEIAIEVSEKLKILPLRITGSDLKRDATRARHVVCYLAKQYGYGPCQIARYLNWNDHSTAVYGERRAALLLRHDPELAESVREIECKLIERLKGN